MPQPFLFNGVAGKIAISTDPTSQGNVAKSTWEAWEIAQRVEKREAFAFEVAAEAAAAAQRKRSSTVRENKNCPDWKVR